MKSNIYGPILIMVTVLLTLSATTNIVFYKRIQFLDRTVLATTSPVSESQIKELSNEIERLSNIKYDIRTKQPIHNDFVNPEK